MIQKSNFIEIILQHRCSPVSLLHIFRIPFLKNTFGWLPPKLTRRKCIFSSFHSNFEYFSEMEQPINQNHSQPRKAMFLPQMILKTTIGKLQPLYTV